MVNRYLPHHSYESRREKIREAAEGAQGLLPFSEMIKYFQPYDFSKIDASLQPFAYSPNVLPSMDHVVLPTSLFLYSRKYPGLPSTLF